MKYTIDNHKHTYFTPPDGWNECNLCGLKQSTIEGRGEPKMITHKVRNQYGEELTNADVDRILDTEQEGISASQIAFFSNHIKDIPTIILKDVLSDIVYELKDREDDDAK